MKNFGIAGTSGGETTLLVSGFEKDNIIVPANGKVAIQEYPLSMPDSNIIIAYRQIFISAASELAEGEFSWNNYVVLQSYSTLEDGKKINIHLKNLATNQAKVKLSVVILSTRADRVTLT